MSEQERITQLEKEVAELKEIVKKFDERMRTIFQEEYQREIEEAMEQLK